jgi:DNA invertase Pin-like site-specific DNA recombinase
MAQEYAARMGLELDDKLTFQDLGVSAYRGRNIDDGRLGDFLEAVKTGLVPQGSYLLVESLDRISRDKARRALRTLESIVDSGVTLVTLADGGKEYTARSLDDDPTSLLMSILVFMRSNEESATKSRRLKSAWDAKRSNVATRPLTSIAPAWLELDTKTGKWKLLRERVQVVRTIFRLTLQGTGQHDIARDFNQRKVPLFGRGSRWHRSYIVKVLNNPAVMGTLIPHRMEYVDGKRTRVPLDPIPDYFPVVVDANTYTRVQAMRETSSSQRGRHAGRPIQNVLAGLARCPICDGSMTRVSKGAKRGGKPYLVCSKAKAGAGCQYRAVHYEQVEKRLREIATDLAQMAPVGDVGGKLDDQLEELEVRLDIAETGLEHLLDAVQAEGRRPVLMDRLRKAEAALEALHGERRTLSRRKAELTNELIQRRMDDLVALLKEPKADRGQINRLLRTLLWGVTVNYPSGLLRLHWRHGGETETSYGWPGPP